MSVVTYGVLQNDGLGDAVATSAGGGSCVDLKAMIKWVNLIKAPDVRFRGVQEGEGNGSQSFVGFFERGVESYLHFFFTFESESEGCRPNQLASTDARVSNLELTISQSIDVRDV